MPPFDVWKQAWITPFESGIWASAVAAKPPKRTVAAMTA
jgi:hypothetical protein